jgi:ubiquinone/menaquinone biosynthesis C-methylase UbiE
MILFNKEPQNIRYKSGQNIYDFAIGNTNIDINTVESFGEEWTKFNNFSEDEISDIASAHYFDIVQPAWINNKHVLDVGCGTGRWTKYVAKYANTVNAIDPSSAIETAATLLAKCDNVTLSQTSVDNLPFPDESFDFIFSLGVLHHIPDTELALKQCVDKLKRGGYFLTYLYYDFDNRGAFFKAIFFLSDIFRRFISRLPKQIKNIICDIIAIIIYLPLIMLATFFKIIGLNKIAKKMPLHFYVKKTFNVIRNDARDRFGTPLEQRFTKSEIQQMMEKAGLSDVIFSDNEPYWHAVGKKK